MILKDLMMHISSLAIETDNFDGTPVRTLTVAHTEQLADKLGTSCQAIEIAALENGIVPMRYLRNQHTFNCDNQIRLLKSKAVVVGLGGLGGSVVEILARAGVGSLVLIDGDRFEDHNLNRQVLSTRSHLGEAKARAASQRVADVNAAVHVQIQSTYLTSANAASLIGNSDVAVDCLDNIPSRFDLETAAKEVHIPLVSGAVAGVTGHVTTICSEDVGLELIYGSRRTVQNPKGAETTLGCLPQAVSLVAAMQSAEAIKILLNQTHHILRNKLWVVDLTDNTFEVLTLA